MESCIVVQHLCPSAGHEASSIEGKRPYSDLNVTLGSVDSWFHDEVNKQKDVCEPEWVDSEDPLFLLYTR